MLTYQKYVYQISHTQSIIKFYKRPDDGSQLQLKHVAVNKLIKTLCCVWLIWYIYLWSDKPVTKETFTYIPIYAYGTLSQILTKLDIETSVRCTWKLPRVHSFIQVVCLTTGPKPLPKRALHIVRSRASSFKWEYHLLSLRSSSNFLRLLPRLPDTSIPPFIFPSITGCRRQFLRRMWPIQFAFRLRISCKRKANWTGHFVLRPYLTDRSTNSFDASYEVLTRDANILRKKL